MVGLAPLHIVWFAGEIVPAATIFSIIVIVATAVHPVARVSSTRMISLLLKAVSLVVLDVPV